MPSRPYLYGHTFTTGISLWMTDTVIPCLRKIEARIYQHPIVSSEEALQLVLQGGIQRGVLTLHPPARTILEVRVGPLEHLVQLLGGLRWVVEGRKAREFVDLAHRSVEISPKLIAREHQDLLPADVLVAALELWRIQRAGP
eukprot:scaffold8178_cov296-Pinguiococcus_pyrenoidosus.AAC.15